MEKMLLLGDEAIAQGAIDAGISGFYGYPGTPSTEIIEYAQRSKQAKGLGIHTQWSTNEKTAMEEAIGMSYAGKRTMVTMKHVGLNVASDAFINSAITGANGGLIVVVADDPSMHSSQNEQDSRFYGKFAMVPMLEPSNQQEAYDMVHYGFELSEKFRLPVLLRIVTRLSHSRSGVLRKEVVASQNEIRLPSDPRQFVLLPSIARKQYASLLDNQTPLEVESEQSEYNTYFSGTDTSKGIITTGLGYNYVMEHFPDGCPYPLLKITQYPVPVNLIKKMMDEVDEVYIAEEGYPFVESDLRGLLNQNGNTIHGRLDGTFPRMGELNPVNVAKGLGIKILQEIEASSAIAARPPALCPGCGHIYFYKALNEVMEPYGVGRVFADIGCYTLGALPPLNAINSCVDMGASITMAKGAADAGLKHSVAVIGDSTFMHSGMTGLIDCLRENTPVTIFILDNSAVGMTGGQESAALNKIDDIVKGLGVDMEHYHVLNPVPKEHDKMVEVFTKELEYEGVSVIVPRRECVQTYTRRMRLLKKQKQKEASVNK